jgi:hypothetical protein
MVEYWNKSIRHGIYITTVTWLFYFTVCLFLFFFIWKLTSSSKLTCSSWTINFYFIPSVKFWKKREKKSLNFLFFIVRVWFILTFCEWCRSARGNSESLWRTHDIKRTHGPLNPHRYVSSSFPFGVFCFACCFLRFFLYNLSKLFLSIFPPFFCATCFRPSHVKRPAGANTHTHTRDAHTHTHTYKKVYSNNTLYTVLAPPRSFLSVILLTPPSSCCCSLGRHMCIISVGVAIRDRTVRV